LESVTVVGKVTCPCPAGETAQFSVAFGTGFPELSRTITVSRLFAGVTFWILTTWPSPETTETVFWEKAAVASRLTPIATRVSIFAKADEVTGILLIDVRSSAGQGQTLEANGDCRRETGIISLVDYGKKKKKEGSF
jgi:hypothetical protein